MRIRTIIVDDQLLGREHLRRLLQDEPDIELVGTCSNGREAVQAIQSLSPDLVFLDVHMPEMSGFELLTHIPPGKLPVVIFITANDNFALKAFEHHALDYIVKPCEPARLRKAIERAGRMIEGDRAQNLSHRMSALFNDLKPEIQRAERLAVKSNGRLLLLKLDEMDWIEAADNYVNIHRGPESHLVRETMTALEKKLPPEKFLRISRSTIVNIERIKELQPLFHGEYSVLLHNGTRLTLTRNYREKLSQLGVS